MIKCMIDKGVMSFTGDKNYVVGKEGRHEKRKGVIEEYKLVMEILKSKDWAFPVVEALMTRKNALLQNLMDLSLGVTYGRPVQIAKDSNNAGSTGS